MTKLVRAVLLVTAFFLATPAAATGVPAFPPAFRTSEIAVDGATIHTRVGGHGPVVLLLHGFGDTGDMWAPLAARLVKDHTVVVPDLRGMAHPRSRPVRHSRP